MTEILTFRDSMLLRAPSWLRRGFAGKLLYVLGCIIDALVDWTTAAVRIRFPGVYSPESLGLIGRERRISRGLFESDETYAARLTLWLDAHATRGGPYAMLEQLHAFFAPNNFRIDLVYRTGRRFILAADGTITRDDIPWNADLQPDRWARWWLFYHFPTPIASDGTWNSPGTWDDGGVWDSSLTISEAANYRIVPRDWNGAHTTGAVVVIAPNCGLWDYPPGIWDEPGATWDTDSPATFSIY